MWITYIHGITWVCDHLHYITRVTFIHFTCVCNGVWKHRLQVLYGRDLQLSGLTLPLLSKHCLNESWTYYEYSWANYWKIHWTSVGYRLITYIRPGTVGHGLITYVWLKGEFWNALSSYVRIMFGSSLTKFLKHQNSYEYINTTSHEHTHIYIVHLHHGTLNHHSFTKSQLPLSRVLIHLPYQ